MVHVAYIVSSIEQTGPINQLESIIDNLSSKIRVSLIALSWSPDRNHVRRMAKKVDHLYEYSISRKRGMIELPFRIYSKLNELEPDIVHTHTFRPDLFVSILPLKCQKVTTVHANIFADYKLDQGDMLGAIMAWSQRTSFRQFDEVVACSNSVKEELSIRKAKVIRNGIDIDKYTPPTGRNKGALRDKYSIPANQTVFLHVGAFIERKNPKRLIEAFLSGDVPDKCTLVMVGDGPLYSNLNNKYQHNDRIVLPGFVDDVSEYMAMSDYYLSASTTEGLPLAVIEAMAAGTPICLSDIPAHREIHNLNPNSGVIYGTESESNLVEAITEILDSDYTRQKKAARNIVEQHLNAEGMSEMYESMYLELIR